MTPTQRGLARHALGLSTDRSTSYRNRYFCTPSGNAYAEWQAMVRDGLAECEEGEQRLTFFWLTRKGAEAACEPWEKLCPEDFPAADPVV